MRILLLAAVAALPTVAAAKDNDHTNWYKPTQSSVEGVKIGVVDALSLTTEGKFKLTVSNSTPHFVVFKTADIAANFGGSDYPMNAAAKGRYLVVDPTSTNSKVLNFVGADLHQDKGVLKFAQAFYLVSSDAPVAPISDFQLPPKERSFGAAGLKCEMPKKYTKETGATKVKFACTNEGTNFLLVDPGKVQVRTEKGDLFANEVKNIGAKMYQPGESFVLPIDFRIDGRLVDMQFATLQVVFNDAVRESNAVNAKIPDANLVVDPGLTAAKN